MKPVSSLVYVLAFAWCQICNAGTQYAFHQIEFESRAIDLADDGTLLFASPRESNPPKYFVREPNGDIQQLTFPDDTYAPEGINSHGTIVGNRYAPGTVFTANALYSPEAAFHRTRDGEITEFRIPGATRTLAYDINDRGDIVGGYRTMPLDAEWVYGFSNVDLGFVHSEHTGETRTFANPDQAWSFTEITEHGRLIGSFEDAIYRAGIYAIPETVPLENYQPQPPPDCPVGKLLRFATNDNAQTIMFCGLTHYFSRPTTFFDFSYVYDGETYQPIAANDFVAINNDGTLAGTTGTFQDDSRYAFVATVPEPTSSYYCVATLVLLSISLRHRSLRM